MAHRKLQQEIDRVFKKINEGLEIFDEYYERHEQCSNNQSQKDKLESDLKKEIKKLQRLREQIKVWQSSPDVKDKEKLLEYRRNVEVAMEKYKVVEKGSKEKAYSNQSLRAAEVLDPQDQERRDVSDYLLQQIEELDRQFDAAQVDIEKMAKKKKLTSLQEEKRNDLKEKQQRYKWHQQQMEIALRLIENQELDPQLVRDIEEDINYYVESNRDPDFVEDDSIYEPLDLESNEIIAHEVASSFANHEDPEPEVVSAKQSRKEKKKAAEAAAAAAAQSSTPVITGNSSISASSSAPPSQPVSQPIPTPAQAPLSTLPSLLLKKKTLSPSPEPVNNMHTHIGQTNGVITSSTLKPATVPARPAGELKWAAAAAQAASSPVIEKQTLPSAKRVISTSMAHSVPSSSSMTASASAGSTGVPLGLSGIGNSSMPPGIVAMPPGISPPGIHTPATAVPPGIHPGMIPPPTAPLAVTPATAGSTYEADGAQSVGLLYCRVHNDAAYVPAHTRTKPASLPLEEVSQSEQSRRTQAVAQIDSEMSAKKELLALPPGIQEFVMSNVSVKNSLTSESKRGICNTADLLKLTRLHACLQINTMQFHDMHKLHSTWNLTRCRVAAMSDGLPIEEFAQLDTSTLFYAFYFGQTPIERSIANTVLHQRMWRMARDSQTWYLKKGQTKTQNEEFEIGDFKIFSVAEWSVNDKMNFKLDYSSIV